MSWQILLGGSWHTMDQADADQLNDHYTENGETTFTLLSRGQLYDINLEGSQSEWVQRNQQTGRERPIRLVSFSLESKAKKKRGSILAEEDIAKDVAQQHELIKQLVEAKTIVECTALMDEFIDDDWMGGLDAFEGNVYRIIAFGGLNNFDMDTLFTLPGMQKLAEKLGLFFIFIIQLFVPPAIFFSNLWGIGVEHVLVWENMEYGLLAGWSQDTFAIRLTSIFFIFVIALNSVNSLLDESMSWVKIDKMLKFLNVSDGNGWAMYLDAFMNMYVAIWSVLSTFIVLLDEDSISDCVFDAFSLTFLFNLDDIGGDLGFFGNDDWPGLQLAWVDQNMYAVAEKFTEVEEPEQNQFVEQMFRLTAIFLMSMVFVLPAIYLCVSVPVEG